MTAAERMRRLRERRKAVGLKTVTAWVPEKLQTVSTYSPHRLLEARSLAMHAVIARKIEHDPTLLAIAHRNVERWRIRWKDAPPAWLEEWQQVLKQPWQHVAALITEPTENGARLRQSSPSEDQQSEYRRDYWLVPGRPRSGISRYVAGREKDREFTRELVKQAMVRRDILMERERETDLSPELRKLVLARIARDFKTSAA